MASGASQSAPATLPRSARLTDSHDYSRVFQDPSRERDRCFTVLYRSSSTAGSRLGMAVSRRAAPKATDRNRIKRMIRETFRHRRTALGDYDIVVIAKAAARHLDRSQLRERLDQLWNRIEHQ